MSNMKVYPMRLPPGAEIKSSLLEFVRCSKLNAAFIFSCVVVVSGKQLFVLLQVLTRHIRCIVIMLYNLNLTLIFTFICI